MERTSIERRSIDRRSTISANHGPVFSLINKKKSLSLLSKMRRDEERLQKLIFVLLSRPGLRWVETTIKACQVNKQVLRQVFYRCSSPGYNWSRQLSLDRIDISSGLQKLNDCDNHKDVHVWAFILNENPHLDKTKI